MCGVVGIYGFIDAAEKAVRASHHHQHRAQEFFGLCVATPDGGYGIEIRPGFALQAFSEQELESFMGQAAIAHSRYPTAADRKSGQPLVARWGTNGWVALGHNGGYTNDAEIRASLCGKADFKTGMDSEAALHLILNEAPEMPQSKDELFAILGRVEAKLKGAGSLVLLFPHCLIGLRGRGGCHPLSYGQDKMGRGAIASESGALFPIGVIDTHEVPPGSLVCFSKDGMELHQYAEPAKPLNQCFFNFVYTASVLSDMFGANVGDIREASGRKLAEEHPVPDVDLIFPVPESGNAAATGFAEANPAGQLDTRTFLRSNYIQRTFIAETQEWRDANVKEKFNAYAPRVKGARVVLIDDSLVRGTTSQHIMNVLWSMGAAEVHLRIACPPWSHNCLIGGADTRDPAELAINKYGSVRGIQEFLGVTSLEFLSTPGMCSVLAEFGLDPQNFCMGCVDGVFRYV